MYLSGKQFSIRISESFRLVLLNSEETRKEVFARIPARLCKEKYSGESASVVCVTMI